MVVPPRAAPARRRRTAGRRLPHWLTTAGVGLLAIVLCLGVVLGVLVLLPTSTRTNVLLLGVDRREGTSWAHLTDTIMILAVDGAERRGGLLSIPRDLQVTIPGYWDDRINTANVQGYRDNYPGGGPALLQATVEFNFEVPIAGYVMIDFQTFEQMIDSLGGIEVEVSEPLHDTQYPDPRPGDPYAFKTVHFDAGPQHMDGQRALEYARSRMSTSDFDRARRQQQILVALRRKALSVAGLFRVPAMARIALSGVQTDLSPFDLAAIARALAVIKPASLEQVVLESPLVYDYQRPDGALVELPNWELINPVIEEMFAMR